MTTIKGPIVMKDGFSAKEFMDENSKGTKIKLPFEATGWKSQKNSNLVDGGEPLK